MIYSTVKKKAKLNFIVVENTFKILTPENTVAERRVVCDVNQLISLSVTYSSILIGSNISVCIVPNLK